MFTSINKQNDKSRLKAQQSGEPLFRKFVVEDKLACATCGDSLMNDLNYKGIGSQLMCRCAKWRWGYVEGKYEKV